MRKLKKFNESVSGPSRLLMVSGGDFSALEFSREHSGKKVSDIIDNLSEYEGDEFDLEVYEFGEVDPKFVSFVKQSVMDYDQKKDTNFFFEWETLGEEYR
jgi:hypothetical protein